MEAGRDQILTKVMLNKGLPNNNPMNKMPAVLKGPIHDQINSQYIEANNGRPIFDKIFESIKILIKIHCAENVRSGCCRCRRSGFG